MNEEKTIEDIEQELEELQLAYIDEDDDIRQMELERKFTYKLMEATKIDGIDRLSMNVTIHNWVRQES
jgi:hypothetical protein